MTRHSSSGDGGSVAVGDRLGPATRGAYTRALAGRDQELTLLREWLADAASGRGRVVVVSGGAGIGKTRLAQELAGIALAAGVRVAWGRCTDEPAAPPLWPWRQVMRTLGLRYEEAPEGGRFEQLDDVAARIVSAGGADRCTVVVLDDAHWADEPSLIVLRQLADRVPESRTLLLVNHRHAEPDTPLHRILSAVLRVLGAERLELRGLTADEVAQQLAAAGPGTAAIDPAALCRVTGGNPLFVAELAAAVAGGRWHEGAPPPPSVVEVIRARLAGLSADVGAAVGIAAVAGLEFDVDVVAAAARVPVDRCLELLDEAVEQSFVEPTGQAGRYRFVHALTRDAIVGGLGRAVQLDHHRALAEVLEARPDARLHARSLAEHWAAVAPAVGPDQARRWAVAAADDAVAALAHEDAVRLYRSALALPGATEEARCEVLIRLARAAFLAADLGATTEAAVEAATIARQLGDHVALTCAALTIGASTDPRANGIAVELCEEALAAVGPRAELALRARLLAQRSHLAFYGGEPDLMRRLSEDALRAARACGDDEALMEALRARQEASPGPAGRAERATLAEEMVQVAGRAGNRRAAVWGHLWAVDALVEDGRLAEAERRLEKLAAAAGAVGGPAALWLADRCSACIAQARGDLETASTAARRGHERMRRAEPEAAHGAFLAIRCGIGHHAGPTAEGLELALRPFSSPPLFTTMRRTGRAFLLVCGGDLDAAARELELAGPVEQWSLPPFYVLPGLVVGARTAAALGRADAVRQLLPRLEQHRDAHVAGGAGVVVYLGPMTLHLGVLHLFLGSGEAAVRHLAAAVQATASSGAAGYLAEARHHLAAALSEHGAGDDAARARELATQSEQAIRALGLRALEAPNAALLERLRPRASASPLSSREDEVARLVSQGLTNREIATRLVISERTAQNHVQHILTKLGFSSRSQIAAWWARGRG